MDMADMLEFPEDLTPEGTLALYLARDFARAGMSPEKVADKLVDLFRECRA